MCSILHESDASFDAWYMLASCTDFDMCCNFILKFLEFVVSVDKINLATAISENGKDLFYTIDDVFGSSFVR